MTFMCLVQHGAVASAVRQRLEAGLGELARREWPHSSAPSFAWMEIASGCGFTAGEPSRAAIAATTVPTGTTREARTRFLSGICELWVRETGCHLDDIVATAFDDGAR